jgi:hypothetical protein
VPRSDISIFVSLKVLSFFIVVVVQLLTRKSPTLRIRSTEREEESERAKKTL